MKLVTILHHTSRRCMFRFSLLGKSIYVYLSFRSYSGLTVFQFVTSFFLHGMLESLEKESFKKSSKWEGKVYVRCTCVCKSESVFLVCQHILCKRQQGTR